MHRIGILRADNFYRLTDFIVIQAKRIVIDIVIDDLMLFAVILVVAHAGLFLISKAAPLYRKRKGISSCFAKEI